MLASHKIYAILRVKINYINREKKIVRYGACIDTTIGSRNRSEIPQVQLAAQLPPS